LSLQYLNKDNLVKKVLTEKVQLKIEKWKENNLIFFSFLASMDLIGVKNSLEKDFHKSIGSILSEDEIVSAGQGFIEDLEDEYRAIQNEHFKNIYKKCDSEFLEEIAPFLIYSETELGYVFRKNYFAYTKNYEVALNYADILLNSLLFLKNQRHYWLMGALYNENSDFFNDFLKIYLEKSTNDYSLLVLTGKILDSGLYYNIKSWESYYYDCFDSFYDDKLVSYMLDDETDIFHNIFYELIKYPISDLNNEDKQIVSPIIDILLSDYESLTGINKLEYMMVSLAYKKEEQLKKEEEKREYRSSTRYFSKLRKDTKLINIDIKLREYILKSINLNKNQECIDVFRIIGIPIDRYEEFNNYMILQNEVDINLPQKKKINKI